MKDWRPFDTSAFLKASRHWEKELRKLQEEHDNISELPATGNNSGVRSRETSDLTARMAIRRLEIVDRMEEIRLYEEMLAYALKSLTEDERALIDGMFFSNKRRDVFVENWARSHGIRPRAVYDERNRVLRKMGDTLLRVYYEEET